MDSPRSEKFETTRFSTPVSELDDHRHQTAICPVNMPNSPLEEAPPRRGTFDDHRVDRLMVRGSSHDHAPISRDFEQAIVDDDKSDDEQDVHEATTPRRGFSRRIQQKIEVMGRSRD